MDIDLSDQLILITGASSGIGLASAKALAGMKATVVMASRASGQGEQRVDEVRRDTANPNVHYLPVDLSNMQDIRRFVTEFKSRFESLDVLVNNAGIYVSERRTTAEGLELTFALNHLGYFLPTLLLLDLLKGSSPARIINVASEAARGGKLHFDDPMLGRYSGWKAYSQSKLANIVFTIDLAKRLEGSGVTVNALHPGGVATGFGQNDTSQGLLRLVFKIIRPLLRSPEKGAETVIYLASSPEVEGISGQYYQDKRLLKPKDMVYDTAVQTRLWQLSEKLCQLSPAENPFKEVSR